MDTIKTRGFLEVYSVNKETGERTLISSGDNTVTELGKELFMHDSVGLRFKNIQCFPQGCKGTFSSFGNHSSNGYYQGTGRDGLTAYLVNLSNDEISGLSATSNTLSFIDSTMAVNDDKVVGYASWARDTATESAKEGVVTTQMGKNLFNKRVVTRAWRFPAGFGTGTFNCVQIGTGNYGDVKRKYNGVSLWTALQENDTYISGNVSATGYYLKPGIKSSDGSVVITGDNEILIGDSTVNTKARISFNIVTGEKKYLDSTDPRYDMLLGVWYNPQVVMGDYLFYSPTGYNGKLLRYDLVNKTTHATQPTISNGTLFVKDGTLYYSSSTGTYRSLNPSTMANGTSTSMSNIHLPSDFLNGAAVSAIGISNYGDNAYLVTNTSSNSGGFSLIVTDPFNVENSIIGYIPKSVFSGTPCVPLSVNGAMYLIGNDVPADFKNVYKNNGTEYINALLGLCISQTWGNMLSFKTLSTPHVKGEDSEIIIEYGYEFT